MNREQIHSHSLEFKSIRNEQSSFYLSPATLILSPVTAVLAVSSVFFGDILYIYKQMCVCVPSRSPLFYTNGTIYSMCIHCPAPYFLKLPICLGDIFIFIHRAFLFVLLFFKTVFHCLNYSIFSQSSIDGHLGFPDLSLLPAHSTCHH